MPLYNALVDLVLEEIQLAAEKTGSQVLSREAAAFAVAVGGTGEMIHSDSVSDGIKGVIAVGLAAVVVAALGLAAPEGAIFAMVAGLLEALAAVTGITGISEAAVVNCANCGALALIISNMWERTDLMADRSGLVPCRAEKVCD